MDVVSKKDSEKQRSRTNRAIFRSLIDDINCAIGMGRLNTNKCLSVASSLLKLAQFYVDFNPSEEALMSNVTKRVDVLDILCSGNLVGIGFDQFGKIIYASPNFKEKLGLLDSILGDDLNTIAHKSDEILTKVFVHNHMHFVCLMHLNKSKGKDTVSVLMNGRVIMNSDGLKMYLGYGELKEVIVYNPGSVFCNKEILLTSDFKLINRHIYIDSLLGYDEYSNDAVEHLHSEDLLWCSDLKHMLDTNGFCEKVFRLLSVDGRYLFVQTKVYPHVTNDGTTILVTYSWPFAFSSDGDSYIAEGLKFLTNNDSWLSLVPSFFSNPNPTTNSSIT